MVSSGCPAKTRQTPPNPPAKKFFSGLIGCGCLDIFTFCSGRKTKQRRLNKTFTEKKPRHTEKQKAKEDVSPGRLWLCGMSLWTAVTAAEGPFTQLLTRTGLIATQRDSGPSPFGVRVETNWFSNVFISTKHKDVLTMSLHKLHKLKINYILMTHIYTQIPKTYCCCEVSL